MSAAKSNRALIQGAYDAFFRGDPAGFLSVFDPSASLVEAGRLPYGGVYQGMERIAGVLQAIGASWSDLTFEIKDIVADDDIVVAYGHFSATAKKSGKRVSFPIAEVWRIRGGKAIELTPIYGDLDAAIAALT